MLFLMKITSSLLRIAAVRSQALSELLTPLRAHYHETLGIVTGFDQRREQLVDHVALVLGRVAL